MRYINYNGNIYSEHEKLITGTNRGLRYGDGFFETMVMFDKKIPLLDFHWSRISYTMDMLEAEWPPRFDPDRLVSMVLDLASVNGIGSNTKIRIQFFRKGEGLYLPVDNEMAYVISMESVNYSRFESGMGMSLAFSEVAFKGKSSLSDIKSSSALGYVLAAQYLSKSGCDELVLTNDYGQISECLYSNIIVCKDDRLITTDLDSGCVNGVMRSFLLGNYPFEIGEGPLELSDLEDADEILLTNAVKGVRWVKSFKDKTYGNKKAVELTAFLNRFLKITS